MSDIDPTVDDRSASERSAHVRTASERTINEPIAIGPAGSSTDVFAPAVAARAAVSGATSREKVVERERAEFGGMKFGSAFFGWLTATGTAVILTAVLAATGTAIGLGTNVTSNNAADVASRNTGTIGLVGAIVLALVVLIAYYCGGYVAGRMARFDGVKQGVAVWLWAIIVAVVLAIVGLVAGSQFNVLANVNSFPRIPIDEGTLTAGSIITVVIALVLSFLGAILGGLSGMRYHRRIDRVGLGR
ncbi:hypothetical protein [Glaciihabitans sp. UYNi722]|uniref:hypothetical protein n=1 Tax=Glaciihabitans sp. UYNi722 TaxID=3156344 RepID=UPI00339A16A5